MNETSLKIFAAICETGSFTKAANELFITQPAVSRHVQALEHHYGVTLFERRGRNIFLTANGEILRDKTRELFTLHDEIEGLFSDIVELRRGKITICASATVATYMLPSAVADFCRLYPGIQVELVSGNTHEVKRMVDEGEADVGFGGSAGVERKSILKAPIHKERLVIVAPAGCDLCGREVVKPEDMLGYNFIWREKGTQTRLYVRRLFKDTHMPEPSIVVRRVATAKKFAQLEGNLTALPYSVVRREIDDGRLEVLNVQGFDFLVRFNAFINAFRKPGTACTAFLRHLANSDVFTDSASLKSLLEPNR
ncbi:MAG: LysR family transcriptional regulator [Desulfovibrio sp.]|uniref:LysR family transcriptional regulator n=1 Tax=Desulfovibrio sp. 7SRBS1 TaxID=3378064 RepID=UPI003B3F9EA8